MNEIDMNEMERVRRLLREPPPPSPEVSAKALTLLEAEAAGDGKRVRVGRRRFGWAPRIGTGLVVAGAAAAVAIAAVGPGDPSGGGGAPAGEVSLGKEAVLVAAENAAKQESGEYWFSGEVGGQSYVVEAATGSYVMVGVLTEGFRWAGAEPGSATGSAWRMLPARPQTPKDAAAWKKAGSPARIKVWSGDKHLTLNTAEKTAWEVDHSDASGGGQWYGRLTTEELQKLPTDPEKLTEKFLTDEAVQWRIAGAPSLEKYEQVRKDLPERKVDSVMKLSVVSGLIGNSPVPPDVRAGLIRAATALPGVAAIGEVTDPLGRTGVALASESRTVTVTGESGTPPERQGTYQARKEVVFDKETGGLLASQYVLTKPGGPYKDREPGFVIDYSAVRDMGWTDTKPTPPAEQPF
ncbi:CU044_5270 family protein [Actinomadura welshii]